MLNKENQAVNVREEAKEFAKRYRFCTAPTCGIHLVFDEYAGASISKYEKRRKTKDILYLDGKWEELSNPARYLDLYDALREEDIIPEGKRIGVSLETCRKFAEYLSWHCGEKIARRKDASTTELLVICAFNDIIECYDEVEAECEEKESDKKYHDLLSGEKDEIEQD